MDKEKADFVEVTQNACSKTDSKDTIPSELADSLRRRVVASAENQTAKAENREVCKECEDVGKSEEVHDGKKNLAEKIEEVGKVSGESEMVNGNGVCKQDGFRNEDGSCKDGDSKKDGGLKVDGDHDKHGHDKDSGFYNENDSNKNGVLNEDGGYDTPDTDQEEKEQQRRALESKKTGTKLVKRMSFKRDKVDRHYDRLPWVVGAVSRLLGLRMAPANIPWHRRMQTLAVLLWMSTFLFLGLLASCLLVYMFLYTQYWWLSLCYLSWYIPDRTICNRGGRRWQWVRKWKLWRSFRDFFPIHVVKTVELPPQHNYIMCYHPHGVLSAGAFCTFATEGTGWSEMFPRLTPYLLTLEVLFLLPFYREFFLCSGAVSATRASMDHLLGTEALGRALCLVVGGAPESLDCHPSQVILHLEKRKGFIKMALRHGASLVPMFGFGENDIYDQVRNPKGSLVRRIQDFLQSKMGLAPCIFMGRGVFQYSLGFVPYRKPIYVVVGAPIHVDAVKAPTTEQILALHSRYKDAIVDLYNTHKEIYAKDPSVPIQIV